jgi:hypothetical protein
MGIYDRFKTDKNAEVNGVDLDFGDGVVLRVARASHTNPKFKKIASEVMGNDLTMNLKKGDSEELFSKMRLVYAKSIVLGWEGITDEEGNTLEFTVENAIKVFSDLPDFFMTVVEFASEAESFNAKKIEAYKESLGNS